MDKKALIKEYKKYVMPTYTRTPLVLVKGRGSWVWDITGRRYLDFFPGWAVSGMGHAHPAVVGALCRQTGKILHVPNNYYSQLQSRLAKEIVKNSFAGKVFFCNSGAEAVEGAIKLARMYGHADSKYEIITMNDSFHGRTLSTVAATGQKKYKKGFAPLPRGFAHVPFNDIKVIERKLNRKTVAIMLELIQGEGGINVARPDYVQALRRLCDKKKLLLIIDEVQTGMGRTGKMFCYQHYGIKPDIITMAKSLGGGFPIGAMLARSKIADTLAAGTHASTFGGSPLACACALAVFAAIKQKGLLGHAQKMGDYLRKNLALLQRKYHIIKEVRGKGLMLGVELHQPGAEVYTACLKQGLLINCTHQSVLRIMPQLEVVRSEIDLAIKIMESVFKKIELAER